MKKLVRGFVRKLGFDIVRYEPGGAKKSVRSRELDYFETSLGNYYLPKYSDADVVAQAIRDGKIFDEEVINLAKAHVRKGTTVLDLGANFGQMSLLLADMVGSNGKVHSFEADDFIFEILQKNIQANKKENIVIPHFGAVHNIANETLYFPEQDFKEFGSYGSYGIDYTSKKGRKVNTLTIDGLNIQEPISFMKIDIQGGDLLAMKGAVETIRKNKMPILFEYEYQFEDKLGLCFQEYVDFVQSIGYQFTKVIKGSNFLVTSRA